MDTAERARRHEIVTAPAGRRVVVAGPGAGKTALLVERMAHLLSGDDRPQHVLALVFNRRAAGELRHRLAGALPDRGFVGLRIATYHSFALAVADRFWGRTHLAGRPALLPAEEQRAVVRRLLAAEPDPDGWHVSEAVRRSGSFTGVVADAVLRAQEQLVSADELARRDPAAGSFLRRYLGATRADGRLDHAGVLATAAALVADPEVRTALAVRHLLVDEYQDTNAAQAALVSALAHDCESVVLVGDPSQAIYGFRGASVAQLDAAAADLGAEAVELTHGHRCPQPVLDAAGALLAADPAMPPRRPLTGTTQPGGVAAAAFTHRGSELAWVTDHVRALGRHTDWDRIAILCRSLRVLGPLLASALARAGIPHRVGGGPGAAARSHPWVGRMLDLLELVAGADRATSVVLLERVALSPLVGADPLAAREAFRAARRAPEPTAALRTWSEERLPGDPHATAREALGRLLAAVRSARSVAGTDDVATVAWVLWSRLPAAERLAAAAADPGACPPDDVEGARAVGRWHDALTRHVERAPGSTVADYLSTVDAGDDDDLWLADRADAAPSVAVLTVHQAKGLEFDHVVVPALEDGRFPVRARSRGLLDRLALTTPSAGDEERRLLYVALTRTRGSVTLTCTVGTEDQADASPSPFLADLGDHLHDPAGLLVPPAVDPALGPLGEAVTVTEARRRWGRALRAGGDGAQAAVAAAGLHALGASLPWIGVPALPAEGRLRDRPWWLSASAIDTYLDCGRRFMYDRVLRLAPFEQNPAAVFGTAVHDAIAGWLQAEEAPDEELLRIRLHEEFDTQAAPAISHGLERRSYRKRLDGIAATVARDLMPDIGEPVLVEADLALDRPDGHRVIARPDIVARAPGGLEVVDWKTKKGLTKKLKEHPQLAVYGHVVAETQATPVVRLRIGGVVAGHFSELTLGDDPAAEAADLVDGAVDGIAGEVFEVGAEPKCTWCDHRVLCDVHARGLEPPW